MTNATVSPDASVAAAIAADYLGNPPVRVERFSTGIAHWVYDVEGLGDLRVVVKLGRPEQAEDFAGAVHWTHALRPIGVPLPTLLASGTWDAFPFVVLERLPGTDLGAVFSSLTRAERLHISGQVWQIQDLVRRSLAHGRTFGFLRTPDTKGRDSWAGVIEDSLRRSELRLEQAGHGRPGAVARLTKCAHSLDAYFARVQPVPFLDDLTTKNVLVHNGSFAGVVDVDWVCHGDPLLVVALTRAALLSGGHETSYADQWCHFLQVDPEQQAALQFYTALFFLDFLSEIDQPLNREPAKPRSSTWDRLEVMLNDAVNRC